MRSKESQLRQAFAKTVPRQNSNLQIEITTGQVMFSFDATLDESRQIANTSFHEKLLANVKDAELKKSLYYTRS